MNLDDPKVRKTWRDKIAMRRIGDPEDVVGAVAFFASDDAALSRGQTLNVEDGIVLS
ncbi:SDR family oxidoreductase [Sinorhizobium sp. 8-89]|uniref:SDR family oxidoreductase n=1 Tax=Sinorhizobium sp. 7-81 TaxID=3049087 RepID=UPI0024C3B1C1|nr:SDR family oxidoreductase [Sinorhizobium sp. 7-81]MDK1389533.1 SDR family oxidoreductase [Sinorhizobium sp. 7-81]